ncbi:MAG TPA: hypothetical protein VGP93_19165, partial [Polyangiaceae bacterium]|nr:hypothetical protein [Polyangiaceae bacterium]
AGRQCSWRVLEQASAGGVADRGGSVVTPAGQARSMPEGTYPKGRGQLRRSRRAFRTSALVALLLLLAAAANCTFPEYQFTSGGGGGVGAQGGDDGQAGSSEDAGSGGATNNDAGAGGAGGAAGGAGGSAGSSGSGIDCANKGEGVTAPASTWVNATSNLANLTSDCGNLRLVQAKPCSQILIAGVGGTGLFSSEDAGQTWTSLGTSAGSAAIVNRISSLIFDPEDPAVFWEGGTYGGHGVYKTTDAGDTFHELGSVIAADSLSVDLADPLRKTLIASSFDGVVHLWKSTNGGGAWNDLGQNLPMGVGNCSSTLMLDADTYLVGCEEGGIYRSTDGGTTFAQVGNTGVMAQALRASNGDILWPGRYGGVSVSTDGGTSFIHTANVGGNLPETQPPRSMTELPDGRIVAVGYDTLQITSDSGKTWAQFGEPMPVKGGAADGVSGVTYSAQTKTLFIWHWTCAPEVPADAIYSAGFDYETE